MTQVINLNDDKPYKGERYFVDTNVWFWTTYLGSKLMMLPNKDKPEDYQMNDYPSYLQEVLTSGAELCHCPLTLTELANIIENTELKIYKKSINNEYFEKKEYRKITEERKKVLDEIDVAWSAINQMSTCIDVEIDKNFIENTRGILNEGRVDPFDSIFIQLMRNNKIDHVITDDHDFCTVNNQIVVTSNKKALK